MQYDIYSFRYVNEMSYVTSVKTYEDAVKEIDRLAKAEVSKKWWQKIGDAVSYTFIPVGG